MGYILDLRKKLGHDTLILTGSGVIVVNDKNDNLPDNLPPNKEKIFEKVREYLKNRKS